MPKPKKQKTPPFRNSRSRVFRFLYDTEPRTGWCTWRQDAYRKAKKWTEEAAQQEAAAANA